MAAVAVTSPAQGQEAQEAQGGPPDEANLAAPADLPTASAERYREAVATFERALSATEGATELALQAAEAMRALVRDEPGFAAPRYYLGIVYQWTKEFERARSTLHQAISKNPRFHEAYVELGDTYVWLQKPDRAVVFYDKAIEVAPDYALAWLRRGQLKTRRGDFEGALADLAAARERAAGDSERVAEVDLFLQMVKAEVDGPGWPKTFVGETRNYKVLTPVDQAFADEVARHAELIFKTYRRIFPAVKRERRKFTIVVYGSKAEYHKNGGPEGAGGHYSPFLRKLVLFRYPEDKDTKLVLYHEAFHQFLHDYLEDAPQWFDEGLGDFFGPSEYVETRNARGKVTSEGMRVRTNPWRLRTIKQAIRQGRVRSWRKLMLMSQRELYDRNWAGIHYAQSWSIIYFLVRYGAAEDEVAGPYFKLLDAYFEALREGEGQEAAFDASFGRVDLMPIEEEWKRFTLGLGGD